MAREVEDVEVVNRLRLAVAQLLADVVGGIRKPPTGPAIVVEESGAVRTREGKELRPAKPSSEKGK